MQKNVKRYLLTILAALLGFLFLSTGSVHADYTITNYDMNVNLQQDGSADLTQQITYAFKGKSHGVYYNQTLGKNITATQPSIVVQQNGQSTQMTAATTGANNTFDVINTDNALKLKLFHDTNNTTTTFYYSYHITGAVTNWKDIAELNWAIIGSNWNVPLHNVRITIQLPTTNVANLRAWTRSSNTASTTVNKKNGRVTITLKKNPAFSKVQTRVLFPTSVTSSNTLVNSKKHKKTAIAAEENWIKQNNVNKQNKSRNQLILQSIVLLLAFASAAVWIIYLRRRPGQQQQWPETNPALSYDIPPMSAAVAQSIYNDNTPDNNALSAYLLDLAVKNKISIEEFNTKRKDYQLTLIDFSLANSDDMIDFLFNIVGNGRTVTLHELRKYGKTGRESKKMDHIYDKWKNAIETEANSYHYLDSSSAGNLTFTTIFCSISCLLLLWSIYLWHTPWMTVVALILIAVQIFLNIMHYRKHSPYTKEGIELITQLRSFKHMIRDLGKVDMKANGDLNYWAEVLPYAIAFGYNKRVINALQANFTVKELENGLGFYYNLLFTAPVDFGDSFSTSITRALGNYSEKNTSQEATKKNN